MYVFIQINSDTFFEVDIKLRNAAVMVTFNILRIIHKYIKTRESEFY